MLSDRRAPLGMVRSMSATLLRPPNFAALVALVWLLVALALLLQHWPETAETLAGADDAMRLVQMRAWLAGQGWFDLHLQRVQPPVGYESHWSRLIDAGLVTLFAIFHAFADLESAERLMRAWWPLLWLLPTIAGMVAIAWRLAGREAAMVALLLAMAAMPAYEQFTPGRVSHHNVQIALTLLATAATAWADRVRWCAAAAGAISGLALTIGFESLPYLAACGLAFAVRYLLDRNGDVPLRDYGLTLAAATLVGFNVSVGAEHATRSLCDAIAINTASAVICGGLVLSLAGFLSHSQPVTRVMAVVGAGCAALAVLLLFEPRCLGGPFALGDTATWPVWRDHVRDLQPLLQVFQTNPLTAAGIAAFPATALLALLMLAGDARHRRDFGFLAAAAVYLAAVVVTVAAIRAYSYAIWLGMPRVAVAAVRLFATLKLKSIVARALAALLLTPFALSFGAITVAAYAAGLNGNDSPMRRVSRPCLQNAAYAPLAELPPGLVVADAGLGPFVLAHSRHTVLAAPYHRLSVGIAAAHRALSVPPDEARAVLAAAGARYVVVCSPHPPAKRGKSARTLSARLQAGMVPDWLEPVPRASVLAVYRIRAAGP